MHTSKINAALRAVSMGLLFVAISLRGQEFPPNDMFADSATLEVVAGITNTVVGTTIGATRETGEPKHSSKAGGRSVWWRWKAPASQTVCLDTLGSSFDTLLGVYKGNSVGALTAVASNDDFVGSKGASRTSFSATAGTDYYIAIDGFNPGMVTRSTTYPASNLVNAGCGSFTLNIWRGPLGPYIITQPKDTTNVVLGASVSLEVTAGGEAPLRYLWYKDGILQPEATSKTYYIPAADKSSSGVYLCVITNSVGSAQSSNIRLTAGEIIFTSQPQSLLSGWGYSAALTAIAATLSTIHYQWQKDGVPIQGETNSTLSVPEVESKHAGTYNLVASNELGVVTSSNATLTVLAYTFTTLAGNANSPADCVDGTGSAARFLRPLGVAVDLSGNLYVTEASHTIRRVTSQGKVTTIAGLVRTPGTNDGPADTAQFNRPEGIIVDSSGNLVVLDNWNNTVRKISAQGIVSTLAGIPRAKGWVDGPANSALFSAPCAVTLDNVGNLYVAEWDNCGVRRITPDGFVTTIIGDKAKLSMPDGIGIGQFGDLWVTTQAGPVVAVGTNGVPLISVTGLDAPYGGAMGADGNYYIGGRISVKGSTVSLISPGGKAVTIAGNKDVNGADDGVGSTARFWNGMGIAVDAHNNIFLADGNNNTIRKGVPFAVTRFPVNTAVPAGTEVTLDVEVASPGVFSYQWAFNGQVLAGELARTLSIGSLWRSNSGLYSVQISNDRGNFIIFNADVRALLPSVLEPPQVNDNGAVRLLTRDVDGSLPYDPSQLQIEWRTNLSSATDELWQPLVAGFVVTNGYVVIEDTNAASAPARFYRTRQP